MAPIQPASATACCGRWIGRCPAWAAPLVVARQQGNAGGYYNVTWPGYVGVLTAMAPDRFSAGINQPPLRRFTRSVPFDWALGRLSMYRKGGLPPSHLLRRVFDECRDYQEAKRMLVNTPICLPAFFSLSGGLPDQGCVIERTETAAVVHEAPFCITNHWVGVARRGHDRGNDSIGRRLSMQRILPSAGDTFCWLAAPTLNRHTRLVVTANATRGFLSGAGLGEGWAGDLGVHAAGTARRREFRRRRRRVAGAGTLILWAERAVDFRH